MKIKAIVQTLLCFIGLSIAAYIGLGIGQILGGTISDVFVTSSSTSEIQRQTYSIDAIRGDILAALIYGFFTTIACMVVTGTKVQNKLYVKNALIISLTVAVLLTAVHALVSLVNQNNRLLPTLALFAFAGGIAGLLKSKLLIDQTTKCQSRLVWITATSLGWLLGGGGLFVLLLLILPLQN